MRKGYWYNLRVKLAVADIRMMVWFCSLWSGMSKAELMEVAKDELRQIAQEQAPPGDPEDRYAGGSIT